MVEIKAPSCNNPPDFITIIIFKRIYMHYLRYLLVISSSLLLSACGDSYPTAGTFSGGKSANVFSLSSESLTAWQNQGLKINDLSTASETDLLSIRNDFMVSNAVKSNLRKPSLLLKEDLDLDSLVKEKKLEVEKTVEKLSSTISKLEKGKSELEARKIKSEKAQAELKELLLAIDQEEKSILLEYKKLNLEYVKFFAPYTSRKAGAPYDDVNKRFKRNLFSYDNPTKKPSCNKPHVLYADPIKLDGNYSCAYFIPVGAGNGTAKAQAYIASFTPHERATLQKLAELNFKKSNMRRYKPSRVKEVETANKNLVTLAKSFTYREDQQLNKINRTITKYNQELIAAQKVDDAEVKEYFLGLLRKEIASVRPYYLHEELINSLTKVSDVQVDGSFTLPAGNDFYLIESQGRTFESNKYALLRMNHFKNLEVAKVETNNLFLFKELNSLTL